MAGFLSVVYGSLFLFLLSVLKLWLLSRWLLPRLISFVVRRSNEKGVDITVGAVGFFHISDLRVEFLDGPIERVVVGDLLYTGRLLTLLAWLFEFVGKRARGVRLRDHIDDETANGGAEGADTAVRDGDSSPKHSTSAGAFIARSRSLARQSSTVSSNNATSTSVTSPLRASLGSPTGPHASRTSEAGTGGTSGVDGEKDPFDEDEPVREPRRSRSSGGGMMNLNVPVLVAGLRVTLRPVSSGATKPNKGEGDTGKQGGGGEDDGDNTKKKGAGHLAWSTWQLLKNAATFIKVTVTDVSIDARNLNNASLRGVHTARRAVLAATTAFKGRGLTLTALTERIAVGAEDVSDTVTHSCSRTAVRGYLLDGRVDISARYSARERRAVCVGVELDVGELDVETNAGGGGGVSQTFTSKDSDEEGAGAATFSSNSTTVASRLESLPATVSCRLGRVRVRRSARADSIGDGSIDLPLVGVAADLSVRCVRQTKEERVARHRRKNRSLFPDKETIAKLTARSTVEARWRSLDVHTTEHENGIDDTFGDVTESETEPEARSRCGESVFTARFPLVKSNGPKTVVPKATVRAEVRRADGCNHPALVRAVASAVRGTGGFQKKPSRKVGLDGKKERASKPCEWTCDARLHFVDGVRLRAHDGDRGVVGEWHARRWELSEDDLALFGESRRVGIEGGEESRSPGSKLSLSPSISSAVEGLRVALSPVDTVADPRARHTRALRPVLSAERFGWSKGPVSPPPPSPGSWAERDDDSKGGDGNTGSPRSATLGSYARDVELMGATIELTCHDAVALDRSWRRTMESLSGSFSEVKRVQSGVPVGGVKNDDEDDDGGAASESNGPKTPVSTAVTLIDVCARIHADMPTRGHPDVDVTYAPSIPTNSKCALELTVPLSTVSSTDGGTRGGSGWRLETSGWYVTYHDGVCTDADPSADINGVHPAQFADGSETAPGGFNSSSKGRPEMRAENGTVRVLTVEHGAIDHSFETDTTTVSGDGVWGFWQPDAHFMAQEAAAAMNAVSSARKDPEAFSAAGLSEAKDKKSLERRGGVGLDLSRVTFAFDVTAGGAVTLSAHGLTSTDIAAAIRASKPSIAVNGYPVCSSESAEVTFGGDIENDGGKVLPALGETSTSVCDSPDRKRVRLTVGPDTRLVLPWGLDLGDAEAALDAGYAAFVSVGGSPFANSSSSSKSTRASQREVPLEFTLEACGTLRADAFDSPLARCVRGKSAVLGPALASARAAEAAKTHSKSSEKQSAYEARVEAYVKACVAAAAEGAVSNPNGSCADVTVTTIGTDSKNPKAVYHESAARVTIEGGFKSTFVVGGYRSSNNDLDAARSLDELNACEASPSERAAKRADAPWSDNVRLRVSQAARIRIDARDVSVDLPLSPAPVFRCGRFLVEGFVATARQATVGTPGCPPPLPLPVGRRRFGSSRHPASPPRPPVKLYTDVDVTLEHPGGCFAVASEPALMSLSQQLVRMSPPSSGHANAPGGRGGRQRRDAERAAASWDAAHRGWPKGPDGCYGSAAPSLPPWDFWRASWRGRLRVTGSELAYVIDARCAPTIAEVRAGPVGLELGASRIEIDVSPGSINIRAARLTLGARGGVGTPGHDPDDEQPSAANNFGDVDVSLEEKAGMSVCLAVVPAVELTLGFDWATLGNVGGGGQDHHGFDSLTGIERVPYAGQFSVGCHLTAHATLTTKERALPRWRAETDDSTWQGGVDEGAETSKNAAKPPDDSAPTPFVKRDTNRRASLGTPGSMGTPGSLTKWTSGDFFARISGGGGDVSSPNGDVASPNGPPTPSSPSSPAFASRVSAAAAASVADEANTPTIIVGPRALRWLRRFVKDLSSPSGCARRAWRLPTPGGPKRVRHPLSKSINYVIDEVSFSASCDNLRVAHPAESESDPARGLTAQVTGLRVTSRLKPAPPSAQSPYEKTNRVGVGVDGLRRRSTIEPSCVLDTLEVELEEVRVLLPPADNGSEVFSPTGAKKGSNNGGSNNGSNVDSPSGGVSGLRGFGTGDFDQEAEGYKAVIEMLEGRSVGASFQGPGSPGDGSGLTSGVASGVSESRFARESQFARRRRETATDPALVLETRSVKLVRRVDSPPAFTMELTPVNSKTTPPGGVNGGVNPWLHVTVEAPRLLKAASTRDALVQWIRDAYRAALKPNPPKRSLTSLNALASRPDETVDPETGFKLTDGFGDETCQTGSTLNEGSSRATNAERLGLPNHIRGKSASSSGSHGQRAKSSSTSSHMGVGLFDDDFDLIDDTVFGDGQTDAKDETAVTKNATNPTTTPAGTKRREKHQSWDGSPVSTAAAKGDHPNEADLLSLLLHEPKDQAAGTRMGKQSLEPESVGSAAHRRSRSELPASLTLPGDVQEARALTAASVATIPEGRPALKPVAVADAGEEREEEEIMFVVDVTTPQINFEDDDSIFANRGITSPTSPTDADDSDAHWGRRVVAVRLLDAQAHVAPLDVDVYAGVQWLDESLFAPDVETKAAGKQSHTSGKSTGKKQEAAHSYLLRQVFKPCRMDLDFTTHIPEKKKIARVGGDLTPSNNNNNGDNQQPTTRVQDSGNNDGGKTASKSKRKRPEALTEFALRSPEIEAEMSSDQFAALVDVIGSIFLAQIPDHPPRPAMKATALLAVEGRSLVEGEERASAAVVAGPLAAFRVARWAATCAVVDASLAEVFAETQEKCVGPGLGSRSKSGGSKSVPFDGEACARVSRRLARRVEDAERAVDEAVASAEALVRPTRRRPAIKLSLSVDRFRWALRVSGRTFLVARIERLALSRERHVDSSGVTNLRCHELNLDVPPPKVQGARSAQAWADQKGSWKPVLARWDPNAPAAGNTKSGNTNSKPQSENANNRPLVRVSALRAASPPEAPIWDRIEVDVQPFDLRIERDMYDRLIAYIFPEKNGDAGAVGGPSGKFLEGHDAYARSLTDTREEWRRKHGTSSASAGIERGTPSKAPRGFSATTIDPKPESEARKILLGTMSPQRFPPKSATNAQSHKRSATWGADLFQAKGGNGGGGYQELADSDVTDEGQQGHKGGQKDGDDMSKDSLHRRRSRPPSLALPGDTDPMGLTHTGASQSTTHPGATNQPLQPEEHKKVAVRHLKVNEVLLRVSYDGKPRSFHEVRLLLDEVVTANFEGRWRELIGQLKGNVVWSVLKSITGLQGRRLPGGSTQVTAAADKPTHVVVDSPTKKSGTRTDKGTRAPYKHISESEDEDAFGDDDDDDGVTAGRDGGDGVNAGAYGSQSAGPKRKTKSLFKRVFGVSSTFKTAASSDKPDKTSADEREKLARLMGGKR